MVLRRQAGDWRGIAEVSNNLGMVATTAGDLAAAWNHYVDALRLEHELGFVLGVGRSLFNLGEVAQLRGEVDQASRLFAGAESLFTKTGSKFVSYATDALTGVVPNDASPLTSEFLRQAAAEKSLDELVDWALSTDGPNGPRP
jgi:hypothetical protein